VANLGKADRRNQANVPGTNHCYLNRFAHRLQPNKLFTTGCLQSSGFPQPTEISVVVSLERFLQLEKQIPPLRYGMTDKGHRYGMTNKADSCATE
jgi:hypothetical protein